MRRCPGAATAAPMAIWSEADEGDGQPVVLREPDVALVAGEVGGVAAQQGGFGVHGAAGDDPADVGPPGAVLRGVRVAFVVGVLVVDAVGGDPEDRSALKRHGAAGGDEVLEPLGGAVAAVGQQAVVAHADADVDGEEVGDGEGGEVLPREEEERGDGADVEQAHDDRGDPVDAALLVLTAHAEVHLHLTGGLGSAQAGSVHRMQRVCGGVLKLTGVVRGRDLGSVYNGIHLWFFPLLNATKARGGWV